MKNIDNIPKQNNFKTPDGYFEKLPQEIQSRIQSNSKTVSWLIAFKSQVSLAFFMIGILLFYYIGSYIISPKPVARYIVQTTDTSEISNSYEFEESMIISEIIDSSSQNNNIKDDEIEAFLIDENIEYEILLAEL